MPLLWRLQNNNAKRGYTIPLVDLSLLSSVMDTSANFLSTRLVLASEQRHIKFYHHTAKSAIFCMIADNEFKMLIGASREEKL